MTAVPYFSVIIPSHGRPGPLSACLAALGRSDFPADAFEIVVADDGSPGGLAGAVAGGGSPEGVRWVRLAQRGGPAAARNAGAQTARGTHLAFTDDDCLVDRHWLARLQAALRANPGCAVGGRITGASGGRLYCAADQAILEVAYAHHNADPADARFFGASNLAVPADSFRRLGGFDQGYRTAEDRDFCARWLAAGHRLVYADDAVVAHAASSGFRRFWSRHFAFGKGAYLFRRRHASHPSGRLELEPAGFYVRLVLSPFSRGLGIRAVPASGLILLSQFASAAGFLAARFAGQTSNGRTA